MQRRNQPRFLNRPICAGILGAVFLTPVLVAQSGPIVWVEPSLIRVGQSDAAGTGAVAQLEAARGEYESYQVIVKAPAGGLSNVNFSVSDLSGPGGASISTSNITLYREHYVDVTSNSPVWSGSLNMPGPTGWYPDGLIPFVDPDTKAPLSGAALTAVPFTLSASQNQPLWVDVFVPTNAVAGAYTGSYTVTSNQGNFTGQVALTVWNFTLPSKPALQSSFQTWTANNQQTNEELLRNRIQPKSASTNQSVLMASFGLEDYDLGYFSGANYGNCSMTAAPSVSQFQSMAAGQQPGLKLYNYSADEVDKCTNLYPTLQAWARNLHQAGLNQLVTMAPVPQLFDDGTGSGRSAVDIWVVLPIEYDQSTSNIQAAIKKGDQVWSYNGLIQEGYSPKWQIDFAPINYRIQAGFINQSLNLNGLLYWRVDMWSADPWNNVYAYPGSYPGEAVLIYPGSTVGIPGSAPSMRLKYLRDGADDFDYIQLLKDAGQGAAALKIAASVGPDWTNWTRDPNVLYNARHQMGQMLDALGAGASVNLPEPVNPTPANGASNVSTNTALTWTGDSKATSYDVYVGTSSNPVLAGTTAGESFSPGALAAGTQYYWRIVAKNSTGSASSATWSFTTSPSAPAPAPAAPAALSPANGSTGISLQPTLTWTASSGATSYQVYFGSAAVKPTLAATVSGTSFAPGTLTAGTSYSWYVVAVNSGGSARTSKSSFTTDAPSVAPPSVPASSSGAVSPSSGTGVSATFKFSFSNSAGYANIAGGTILINSGIQWSQACWIYYDNVHDQIWLASDDTTAWTSGQPGSALVLSNSQCTISLSGTSVKSLGTKVKVTIPVTFSGSFAGPQAVYLSTNNSGSGQTAVTQAGAWIVP